MKYFLLLSLLLGSANAATNRQVSTQEILLGHITTPSNPAAGKSKVYAKSDDLLYILTSGGTESRVGSGDFVGPASSTDNAVCRFDGTTGKLSQNSGVIIDDSNNITGAANISATGVTLSGLTASRALTTDGSKNLASSAVTSTELGYVSGVTSAIQTQIDDEKYKVGNILLNPTFETSGNWTASGGATTAINSTAVGTGAQGYDWDSNSASQTLTSDAITIPNGLKGRNGVVSCAVKAASGTATHLLQVYDGTNVVASGTISSSTSVFSRTSINFVFPSSGTVAARLISVASNEPEVYVDDCYLGPSEGYNISSIAQATFFGSITYAATTNCNWQNSGNATQTYQNFPADTDCPTPTVSGFVSAPGTKIPGAVISSLPPGRYMVVATGVFQGGATAITNAVFRLHDGTNPLNGVSTTNIGTNTSSNESGAGPVIAYVNYTAPQSNVTIQMQSANYAGVSATQQINTNSNAFNISIYRYPSSEETVYRPEVQNVWGSTYWPDGTTSFTTTSASYTAVTAASMLGTAVRTGKAVACADTNAICIEIPSMPAGSYKVEYSGGIIGDSGTSCSISAYDGTTDYEMSGTNGGGAIAGHTVITYSSQQTDKEFTIRVKRTSGANNCQVASSLSLGHNITITPLSQNIPAPVLVGSVTSNSTSAIRVEGASLAAPSAGSCAVTEVGGSDWINGNCTSGATGVCTCTLNSGVFSSAPKCQISIENLAAGNSRDEQITSTSTSTIVTFTATSGGTAANNDVFIMCMGAR